MAWNQPGGGGRDPWGDRGGQQGPPDLDEVLKKLQGRLGGLFGGRRPSGGGGLSIGGGGAKGIGVVLVLALIGWALAGIYIVDPAEEAVVLRFGKYVRSEGPGPHWAPYFIDRVEKVDVQQVRSEEIGFRRTAGSQSSVPNEALMLTEDENIIDIQFAVQYRVSDPAAFKFNVVDPSTTLKQATESAVREIVGKSKMDFVITEGRGDVAARAETLIQEILDRYGTGLRVTSVNMQNAQPPKEVQEAFFDAVKAREDQVRLINEARAYKADVVPKAEGEANAIHERAMAYKQRVVAQAQGETDRFLNVLSEYQKAPDITRDRLYLESVESVLSSTSKVLIDVPGGNNLMYLPLDRLLGPRGTDADEEPTAFGVDEASVPRAVLEDARRSRSNLRGRAR